MAEKKNLPYWAVKFKRFRMSKGLDQKTTAKLLGISIAAVRSYEQGLRRPKEETMQLMAEKMGLDIYEIFFNSEVEEIPCN